jgi:RNA polymerase sigma factor (sigma-70 family)
MRTPSEPESTVELTTRAREGDQAAIEALCGRCLHSLSRYAAGRVPSTMRDMLDTQDVVNEAVHRGISRLHDFEVRHPGALVAYMRTILRNLIIDYVRRRTRQPLKVSLDDQQPDCGRSPFDHVVGTEQIALYQAALARLKPRDAAFVRLKIEEERSHEEIASMLGLPSDNAARVATRRAVLRLAREISRVNTPRIRPRMASFAPSAVSSTPRQAVRHYPDEATHPRDRDRGNRVRLTGGS